MKKILTYVFALFIANSAIGQNNVVVSNSAADAVLKGNYNPQQYLPTTLIHGRTELINGVLNGINADTLKANLMVLETFHSRNSGSDTNSSTRGIGAARRWIHSKMQSYSQMAENRLLTGYLDFEEDICDAMHHRNVFGILPGIDTSKKGILLVEAHMDSRCEDRCDTSCYAPGMDDNASGTVLVMELARVMSQFAFDRTIVFTTVTGEEQNLVGGRAWAKYFVDNDIDFMACFNNDVIGGVICGESASPPGCSPEGAIDSTNVRIFSFSVLNDSSRYSQHKQLARYVKLQQIEEINPLLGVPMNIDIRILQDRERRGGDHIPFNQRGLTAIRFSSAHEHGDGTGTAPDRQHTTTDILGVDTDLPPDGVLDSFYVDFNYLSRNTITNGVNLALLGIAPRQPSWSLTVPNGKGEENLVTILDSDTSFKNYRIGVRSAGSGDLYFDTVYSTTETRFEIPVFIPGKEYFICVANVENGVESLFSEELSTVATNIKQYAYSELNTMVFPNPVQNVLNIQLDRTDALPRLLTLKILNMSGQLVMEKSWKASATAGKMTLNVSDWTAGTYHTILKDKGRVVSRNSFIISR